MGPKRGFWSRRNCQRTYSTPCQTRDVWSLIPRLQIEMAFRQESSASICAIILYTHVQVV